MSIFQRSVQRELAVITASAMGVLIAIIIVQQMIFWLRRAASGGVEPEAVVALMGFAMIGYLPVLLALSMFIGVLLTLTRSYRDSEMPVWFSSGLSIAAWIRPVVRFGIPVVLGIAALSLFLTPWALSESGEYQRQLRSKDDVSRIAPGSFIESRGANQVFFVDRTSDKDNVVNNVFVQYVQGGRSGVVVAEKGYQENEPNGDKYLVLVNGRRYEGTPGQLDFRIIDFEKQSMLVKRREEKAGDPSIRQMTTWALAGMRGPEHMAELHWRVALPIAALVLALLAIPLAFVHPRSGTSLNLFVAVLVFFIYYNLLTVFQNWTAQRQIPDWLGLWPVHFLMVGLLAILFARQLVSFRWIFLTRRRERAKANAGA
ncbi:MAG: LPS export ABC transporter permease LptF [Betaproteobacteria bacterium]|nr:LPS export ABC transporter permease LptF [Betaproteobacteria bacterium]